MTLKIDDIFRLAFILISIFFLLMLTPIIGISVKKLELMVLGFVITVGMSHGSLDWLLAAHFGIWRNFSESVFFLVVYSVIALLSLGIWLKVPTVALVFFLLMSILHFANDWKDELARPAAIVIGVAVVTLPGVVFQKEVLELFSLLVPTVTAVMLSNALHKAGSFAIVCASLIAYQQIKISPYLAAEIIGLLVMGILLPPIIYFGIYFCVLHTAKHWLRMKRMGLYKHFSQVLWSVVWPTALCILIGVWVCHISTDWSFSDAFIRTVFMGLSALTVPHWLLVEIYPIFFDSRLSGK